MHSKFHKGPNWQEIFCGEVWKHYAFWFIVLFLGMLTVKDVAELCIQYVEDPSQSDFTVVFNESMTMPNITFCMGRTQAMSHFVINTTEVESGDWDTIIDDRLTNLSDHSSFLEQPWDYRMIMEAYECISSLYSLERETTLAGLVHSIERLRTSPQLAGKRDLIKKWLEAITVRSITFGEFVQKTGVELLKRSMMRFQRTTFDDNDDIRTHVQISWISQNQICFQPLFFGDSWKPITDQGLFFTMLLAHDTNNSVSEEFDCMSVDFHGRPSSMNRFMEGKGRSRDGYNDDLCPSIRHEVFIEVRARYAMLENDDEGTACRIIGDDDDDEFDCRSRCRMHVIRDACHCTAYSLSYLVRNDKEFSQYPLCDYTKCDPHVLRNKYDDRKCSNNCKRHCEQIRYQVDHDQKGPMVQKDLTLINLNWRSFEYINLEQQKVWTFATFIAALGGSIGVWLGLSVLSLLQGITFLYHVIRKKIKKRIASGNIKNSQVMSTNEIPVGWKTSSDGPTPKLSVNPIPSEMAANPFANPYVDHNKEKKRKIRIADEDRSGN